MKNKILTLAVLCILIIMFSLPVFAEDYYVSGSCGNLQWEFNNGTLTISGIGEMDDYVSGGSPWLWYVESDDIKKVVIEEGVTKIGAHAFEYHANLCEVVIPDTVTEIGDFAFTESPLGEIVIPGTVKKIGRGAFMLAVYDVTLCDGTETIGAEAFSDCTSLTEVTIPASVKTIGQYAFAYCESLEKVTFNKGIEKIGDYAFESCFALSDVYFNAPESGWDKVVIGKGNECMTSSKFTFLPENELSWEIVNDVLTIKGTGKIPDYTSKNPAPWSAYKETVTKITVAEGITGIGNQSFSGMKNVKLVVLPESLVKIGKSAFINCEKLETVEMYGSVNYIGQYAFTGCSVLSDINVSGTKEDYESLIIEKGNLDFERAYITYSSEFGKIYASMSIYAKWIYDENTNTLTITNYPHITSRDMLNYRTENDVPWHEFMDEIKTVKVSGVSSLGSRSLFGADNLKTVTILEPVATIKSWSFFNCNTVQSVRLPATLETVGTGAFYGNDALDSVIYDETADTYDTMTIGKSNEDLLRTETKTIDGFRGFQGGAVYWKYEKSGEKGILTLCGKGAMTTLNSSDEQPWLEYREKITDIVVEDGITTVSKYAFSEFSNLKTVTLGKNVSKISAFSFQNSTLETINIPKSVTLIGLSAFDGCSSLWNANYEGTDKDLSLVTINSGNNLLKKAIY
ncbi:MAG: leucine-rich repeat domain-containing protein [Clostridia bacterium]|nr:leucine-rich repeat domain-containing protein [Clostridia bacterium]